jgi:hypothetical protein
MRDATARDERNHSKEIQPLRQSNERAQTVEMRNGLEKIVNN